MTPSADSTSTDPATIQGYLQLSEMLYTAGQPTIDQLDQLATHGIQSVINIALPTSDDAVDKEAVILTTQGISYFHIPVDWQSPKEEDFDLFCEIFSSLHRLHRKMLVHCAKNMRVSAFIYLYRVTKAGIGHEAACRDLFKIWVPADQWYLFLNRIRVAHGLKVTDFE